MTLAERHPDAVTALEQVCLYHLLSAIATARHGIAGELSMTGTLREGQHRCDLDGNAWASAWSPTVFVSVDADHERLDPDDNPDFWTEVPAEVRPLFEQALSAVHGRANAVYWVTKDGFGFLGDTDRFHLLRGPMERYFAESHFNLMEFFALEPTDLALARRLARIGASGAELDDATVAELLGTRKRTLAGTQLDAKAAAPMLAPVGIAWPDPEGSARRHFDSLARA